MEKIGFIGSGNITSAILDGMSIKGYDLSKVVVSDNNQSALNNLTKKHPAVKSMTNPELVLSCKYIIFAVKTQHYFDVFKEINENIDFKNHIFISFAPGFSIDEFRFSSGIEDIKVLRAMPNTPAAVAEGMTGLYFDTVNFSENEKTDVISIFESFGKVAVLKNEHDMDKIVALSGSSPAYIYILIEAMADAGVLTGLPRELCYELVSQSVLGSAKMIRDLKSHPGMLKDAVCSPNGTTIEAVRILESEGFRSSIIEAIKACYDKTQNMEK